MIFISRRKLKQENKDLRNGIIDAYEKISELLEEIEKAKQKIKEIQGAKGGLVKESNKLKNENEELKNNIIELNKKLERRPDEYIVKKIPMGRLPKSDVMKLKSHAKQDKIIKKIYSDMEKDI